MIRLFKSSAKITSIMTIDGVIEYHSAHSNGIVVDTIKGRIVILKRIFIFVFVKCGEVKVWASTR